MSAPTRRNPLDFPCVVCEARARTETEDGEYCKRPSGHTLYGALFHLQRLRLAGHYEKVVLHDESACFLCGVELPDKDPIEALSEVGGFDVSVDGVGHTGALCYSCYFPDGFWRKVEAAIRRESPPEASQGQPTVFDTTVKAEASGPPLASESDSDAGERRRR